VEILRSVHRLTMSHIAIHHIRKLRWTHQFKDVAESLDPCPPVFFHSVLYNLASDEEISFFISLSCRNPKELT
jgi:hypothetical protein